MLSLGVRLLKQEVQLSLFNLSIYTVSITKRNSTPGLCCTSMSGGHTSSELEEVEVNEHGTALKETHPARRKVHHPGGQAATTLASDAATRTTLVSP